MIKRLMATTVIIVSLGGCASSGLNLPSTEGSSENPYPINPGYVANSGSVLPLITEISSSAEPIEKKVATGVRRPKKGEISGGTWTPDFHPDAEYVLPVQTTDTTGKRTAQQTLVTSDLPVGRGSCAHTGIQVIPMGNSVAIAPFPGAPVGMQATCAIEFGGQLAKIIVEATSSRGIAELRLVGRRKRNKPSFPKGVCSHDNYTVSEIVEGGPLGACAIVDATGANSATYIKLPGNAYEIPLFKIGDGTNARLGRSTIERLADGSRLVRVEGPHNQIVMFFPSGNIVSITRGA